MLRFLFCFLFPLILVPMLAAQDFESAIYRLYGDASVVSSLDETDLWRLQHYYSSPMRLNDCNKSALVRCGLFSPYQVASILDYRERMGEILSVAELALVDGFGEYLAEALAPFLSFEKSTGKPAAGTSVRPMPPLRQGLFIPTKTCGRPLPAPSMWERITDGCVLSPETSFSALDRGWQPGAACLFPAQLRRWRFTSEAPV